jgi:putative nucleotidyltransferase with HDIG domain
MPNGIGNSEFKNALDANSFLESVPLVSAVQKINDFSKNLFSLKDLSSIRALTRESVMSLLSVEEADLEMASGEIQYSEDLKIEGETLIMPVWTSSGVFARLTATHKLDWTPFTESDVSHLEMMATSLSLKLENIRLEEHLKNQLQSSIQALAHTIETKDRYTGGHTRRVYNYSDAIAQYLPLTEVEREQVRLAGLLHDIGKIGVSDRILNKTSALTDLEWLEMERHAEWGYDIVSRVQGLEAVAEILKHHHERWDGLGYPAGIAGEEIPRTSRAISVADAFDAMTTERPYRRAMSCENAYETIVALAGTQFDPQIVEAFKKAFPELRELSSQLSSLKHL